MGPTYPLVDQVLIIAGDDMPTELDDLNSRNITPDRLLLRHVHDVRVLEDKMSKLELEQSQLKLQVEHIRNQSTLIAKVVEDLKEQLESTSANLDGKLDRVATMLREHITDVHKQGIKMLWTTLMGLGSVLLVVIYWAARVVVSHALPGVPLP